MPVAPIQQGHHIEEILKVNNTPSKPDKKPKHYPLLNGISSTDNSMDHPTRMYWFLPARDQAHTELTLIRSWMIKR